MTDPLRNLPETTIRVGTVGHQLSDILTLFELYSDIPPRTNVIINLNQCRALSHIAIAFLGGLEATSLQTRNSNVIFDERSALEHISKHLRTNSLLPEEPAESTKLQAPSGTIPFTCYTTISKIKRDLEQSWLGDDWLHADADVKAALASQVYELFDNALKHSGNSPKCFLCGHHYKAKKEMHLCIIDFGIGIPSRVRNFFSPHSDNEILATAPDTKFLQWALKKGNTTTNVGSRGLGLSLLESFVRLNGGCVDIYTQSAHAQITDTASFATLPVGFPGTMINIVYKIHDAYYSFSSGEKQPI